LLGKTITPMTLEEMMMENLATSPNVLCKLATYGRKIAELKAEKLKGKLPSGVGSTTFDRSTGEYVVTFAESIGEAL
jgi:hypothetical protein